MKIKIRNSNFYDEYNRVVTLRGVNVSGNIKNPFNTTSKTTPIENISFVNRPFPISEAHVHFARLKSWGFNLIRYCITWEALEHDGPSLYDESFIDYVLQILEIGSRYNFNFFIDPHQDTWSRFTGGSGAPYWTLQIAGFNPNNFFKCAAALTHEHWLSNHNTPLPKMIWPSNYNKLACATMFTLFFAGNVFAPNAIIHFPGYSQSIQDFLQESFINAFGYLYHRISKHGNLSNSILGFDTLNEPSPGYINAPLNAIPSAVQVFNQNTPTIIQSMLLGVGIKQKGVRYFHNLTGLINIPLCTTIDPDGVSCWLNRPVHPIDIINGRHIDTGSYIPLILNHNKSNAIIHSSSWSGCIWHWHGVYEIDGSYNNTYFQRIEHDKPVDFNKYFINFVTLQCTHFRSIIPHLICFLEPPVLHSPPPNPLPSQLFPVVYAPHWYDGITLMSKSFPLIQINAIRYLRDTPGIYNLFSNIHFGISGIRSCFTKQVGHIVEDANHDLDGNTVPTLLGETGLAFDIHEHWNMADIDPKSNYSSLISFAYDCYFRAFERNKVHFTLWHYMGSRVIDTDEMEDNSDQWNDENLSIYMDNGKGLNALRNEDVGLLMSRDDSEMVDTAIGDINTLLNRLNRNGRCLSAIIRPFSHYTPGIPIDIKFNYKTHYMRYVYAVESNNTHNDQIAINTALFPNNKLPHYLHNYEIPIATICELYVPRYHYNSLYGHYDMFTGDTFELMTKYMEMNGWDIKVTKGVWWMNGIEQKMYWSVVDGRGQPEEEEEQEEQNSPLDKNREQLTRTLTIARHKIQDRSMRLHEASYLEKTWHKIFGDDYGYTPHDYGKICSRR